MEKLVLIVLLSITLSHVDTSEPCRDEISEEKCFYFKKYNACDMPSYRMRMNRDCRKTCGYCSASCNDRLPDNRCSLLKNNSACLTHHHRMKKMCPATCGFCDAKCGNTVPGCEKLKWMGACQTNEARMKELCKESCGYCKPTTPCDGMQCPAGKKCFITSSNTGECRCHVKCKESKKTGPVCSVDGRTFQNLCELKKEECRSNTPLLVKHYGGCKEQIVTCTDSPREAEAGLCTAWKESGFCDKMKPIMERYCAKTCGLCRLPSPPACSNSKHGCCWDNSIKPATGPNGQGCRPCVGIKLCPNFVSQCGSKQNEKFMKENCPGACHYCDAKVISTVEIS